MARLPGTVKALGWVSLLTDLSSHMILPLLPAFLTGPLGAGPALLGAVEGAADAVASLFKIGSGWLSDRLPRRKPMIVLGYGLASAARPLLALAGAPWHVLAVRLLDRTGKGLRGAPRDALLAEATPRAQRGRAFGFQRAMDHTGALGGPLLASAGLAAGLELRTVFALSALPAAASLAVLIAGVGERRAAPRTAAAQPRRPPGAQLRGYLVALAVFTLGNSSDAFLLLRAQQTGVALAVLPLLWSFHHAVKAAVATHGGALSDRIGRQRVILAGWSVYALVYAGFAAASRPLHAWLLFAAYALFEALAEGTEKALVADLTPPTSRGTAFGLYHAVSGGMLLPASLLAGALWERFGPGPAFLCGAALAAAGAALLARVRVPLSPEPP